jgi:hypothetical protein
MAAEKMLQTIEISQQLLRERAKLAIGNSKEVASAVLHEGPFFPATVLFNQEATTHIRQYRLWSEDQLKSMNKEYDLLEANTAQDLRLAQSSEREVPAFPPGSIVLKTIWKLISVRFPSTNGVPSWQPMTPPFCHNLTVNPPEGGWTKSVMVEPKEKPCVNLAAPTIPVTCFFYIRMNAREAEILNSASPEIVDQTFINPAQDGDYLVLLGFHAITREVPQWTWSTFWWHNQPDIGPYSEDRPGAEVLSGPWRNYLMDSTLSMYTPTENDGKEKICFNPYIEAGNQNGVSSNCINCHSRSTYPAGPVVAAPWRESPFIDRFPQESEYVKTLRLSFLLSLHDNVTPDPATDLVRKQILEMLEPLK